MWDITKSPFCDTESKQEWQSKVISSSPLNHHTGKAEANREDNILRQLRKDAVDRYSVNCHLLKTPIHMTWPHIVCFMLCMYNMYCHVERGVGRSKNCVILLLFHTYLIALSHTKPNQKQEEANKKKMLWVDFRFCRLGRWSTLNFFLSQLILLR